jgi:hypothetical protein
MAVGFPTARRLAVLLRARHRVVDPVPRLAPDPALPQVPDPVPLRVLYSFSSSCSDKMPGPVQIQRNKALNFCKCLHKNKPFLLATACTWSERGDTVVSSRSVGETTSVNQALNQSSRASILSNRLQEMNGCTDAWMHPGTVSVDL